LSAKATLIGPPEPESAPETGAAIENPHPFG